MTNIPDILYWWRSGTVMMQPVETTGITDDMARKGL